MERIFIAKQDEKQHSLKFSEHSDFYFGILTNKASQEEAHAEADKIAEELGATVSQMWDGSNSLRVVHGESVSVGNAKPTLAIVAAILTASGQPGTKEPVDAVKAAANITKAAGLE